MTPSLSSSCSLSVISSVKPVDLMGLGLVGHFSAAQQPLDHSRAAGTSRLMILTRAP